MLSVNLPNRRSRRKAMGLSRTRIYRSWVNAHQRCRDSKCQSYERYGKRGIRVCAGWTGDEGFRNFVADMGDMPEDKELDRIDNDKNYSCGKCDECIANEWILNCKWSTALSRKYVMSRKWA